jgi:hypothetical protein|tara:strand:+ start:1380 stop:1832 length:453 start_codon:yes stop_codon:yes gene_type:complete
MAEENRILSAPPGGTGPSLEELINQSGFTPQQMEMMEMIMNDFPDTWSIDELTDIFLSVDSRGINAGDEMFTELYGGGSGMQEAEMATAMETKGALPLGATGVVAGRDGGRIFTGGVPSLQDMERDDMMRYDPPDLRKQEEILMRNMTER